MTRTLTLHCPRCKKDTVLEINPKNFPTYPAVPKSFVCGICKSVMWNRWGEKKDGEK